MKLLKLESIHSIKMIVQRQRTKNYMFLIKGYNSRFFIYPTIKHFVQVYPLSRSLFIDSNIKSLANELSKLLRAQLNIRFIALKLLSTVAVPTGKVFDMVITLNKLGYKSGSMFPSSAIRISARSHSALSKVESMWRQAPNLARRLDKVV